MDRHCTSFEQFPILGARQTENARQIDNTESLVRNLTVLSSVWGLPPK